MNNQRIKINWQFLLMLLCIIVAFGVGLICGATIGERAARQGVELGIINPETQREER